MLVQQPSAPVRQSLVGDVAHQRVPEAHLPVTVRGQEAPERREVLLETHVGAVGRQQLLEDVEVRGRAEHRGVAQDEPVQRGEAVDLAGDEVLHRLGQVGHRAEPSRRRDELLEEQRVATAASHERRRVLARHGLGRRSSGELQRLLRCERQRPHRQQRGVHVRDEAAVGVPPGHDQQPGALRGCASEPGQQVAGRRVEQLDVLEHQHRGAARQPGEQLLHRLLQPRLAVLGIELVALAGGGDVDVQRNSQQRQPREQLGR